MRLSYMAGPEDEGRKIYNVLKGQMRLSATQIKRLKDAGGVFLNGETAFTTRRIHAGELIQVDLTLAERQIDFPPEKGPVDVLYEDECLLALNKPAGIISHPSRAKYTGTLANYAAGYLLERWSDPSCHLVNRLDRDTSGVVLFARNAHIKRLASEALRAEGAGKEYEAVLWGRLCPDAGEIDVPIRREAPEKMRRIPAEDGQRAVTRYETLRCAKIHGGTASLVKFKLETGRTHQIRVHALYSDAPILGDPMYFTRESMAASKELGIEKQLLHAGVLRFCHPLTGKMVEIIAPVIREDMLSVTGSLR